MRHSTTGRFIPLNARHIEHNDGQDRCIARKGSVPKKSNDGVAAHPGMTSLQKAGAGIGGMGHPVAGIGVGGGEAIATSAAASPLAHAYGGFPNNKAGKTVAPVPGQRSRTNEGVESHADKCQHGADMLAQAVKN
jgi:hypothetical protein